MIGERAVFLSGDRDEALPSASLKDVPPRRQRQEQHSPGNDAAQRPASYTAFSRKALP